MIWSALPIFYLAVEPLSISIPWKYLLPHLLSERLILRHQRKKAEKVYRDLAHLKQMAANGRVDLPGDGDSLQLSIYRYILHLVNTLYSNIAWTWINPSDYNQLVLDCLID